MPSFRSSINSDVKKNTLKKGALFFAWGGCMIVAAAFLSLAWMKSFGLLIFLVSCYLIAKGIMPYRRLLLLELQPFEIHIEKENLLFSQKKRSLFKVQIKDIHQLHFIESDGVYGIALDLQHPGKEKVHVLTTKSHFMLFWTKWQRIAPQNDLFLPYFTTRSYQELKNLL